MIILGIDPGTHIIGYGLIRAKPRFRVVSYGVIKTPSPKSHLSRVMARGISNLKSLSDAAALANRLQRSYLQILKIIRRYQPDEIALETVFYSKDVQATVKIGEARAVALLAAAVTNTPIYEYSPAEVKKSVTGNGRADKTQVALMVKHLLSLKEVPKPLDSADALAIAICHTHRM